MKKSAGKKTSRILTNSNSATRERKLEKLEEKKLASLAKKASHKAIAQAQEGGLYITYVEDQKIKVVSPTNQVKVIGKLKSFTSSLQLRKGMKLERK